MTLNIDNLLFFYFVLAILGLTFALIAYMSLHSRPSVKK